MLTPRRHDAAPHQVLIEVHTSSVNPVDWKLAEQGLYITPSQLGADVSGVVVGVGTGCSRLQVNDEVWSDVGYSGLLPGAHGNGAWAEYVTVAEEIVSKKPTSLPHSMAGALPLVALTAYQSMVTAGAPWDPNSNISVVITSGDGGTGSLGVQLAKKMGAQSVRSCAAPDHLSYVADLGADVVVDFTQADVFDGVPDDSIDVVFDNYGANGTAQIAMNALRTGGWYVFLAGGTGPGICEEPACTPKDGVNQLSLWTDSSGHDDLDAIAAIADSQGLTVNVDSSYALEDSADAMARQMSGQTEGKVTIEVIA
mmetsp:Transcript_104848/g.302529  ORF Transcript_104848/g.302529 Transcript_104848/m.302529 type:complete len:311 (+) Transcript_104848:358-1290(+)